MLARAGQARERFANSLYKKLKLSDDHNWHRRFVFGVFKLPLGGFDTPFLFFYIPKRSFQSTAFGMQEETYVSCMPFLLAGSQA